jgi:hypothetical protein
VSAAVRSRARIAGALALVLSLVPFGRARAQDTAVVVVPVVRDTLTLLQRLNIDKLRLTALGVSLGAVKPTQVRATRSYSVHADYGHITPRWRVVFSATFWGSRYSAKTLKIFADSLRKVIRDSTDDYQLDIGRVDISDIALGGELRWQPVRFTRSRFRPYLGGGLAAHVINAEGRAISGTFVERALDNITAGVIGAGGVDVVIVQRMNVGVQARYDLLSGARFGSVRLVGTYVFEPDTPAAAARRNRR